MCVPYISNIMKNIFLETYGCQMNEYDSELVRAILTKEKYTFVKDENDADIIMLNTCAIRENAHRKIYGRIHAIHHSRKIAKQEKLISSVGKKEGKLLGKLKKIDNQIKLKERELKIYQWNSLINKKKLAKLEKKRNTKKKEMEVQKV